MSGQLAASLIVGVEHDSHFPAPGILFPQSRGFSRCDFPISLTADWCTSYSMCADRLLGDFFGSLQNRILHDRQARLCSHFSRWFFAKPCGANSGRLAHRRARPHRMGGPEADRLSILECRVFCPFGFRVLALVTAENSRGGQSPFFELRRCVLQSVTTFTNNLDIDSGSNRYHNTNLVRMPRVFSPAPIVLAFDPARPKLKLLMSKAPRVQN